MLTDEAKKGWEKERERSWDVALDKYESFISNLCGIFISNLLEGQIYFISSPSNFEKQLPILIVFNFKLNLIVIIMIEIFFKILFPVSK